MSDSASFQCRCCGEVHAGWPDWHFGAPDPVRAVPEMERSARVDLTADGCVIDGQDFYAKGLLRLPVQGSTDALTWGVWISLGEADFVALEQAFSDPGRTTGVNYLGWLANTVPGFDGNGPLAARLHVREYPMRPWVELAPTEHPLARAQHVGIPRDLAVARVEALLHPDVTA